MSINELQQLVMVSPEVWQDLHWRYTQWLWPWWLLFILANVCVFLKDKRAVFFAYVTACWVFIGVAYFVTYVQQVHTFALAMGCVFILQGIATLYLKVIRSSPNTVELLPVIRRLALITYGVSAFVPLSYFLENSRETILLFGWGAEQTAIGTVALVFFALRSKVELVLVIIPLTWIGFYLFAL